MKTVTTKEELRAAIEDGVAEIEIQGDLARSVHGARARRKAAKIGGGLVALGGIAAAPFTGGFSLAMTGSSIGTILAVSVGAGLLLAIHEGYEEIDVKAGPSGFSLRLRRRGERRAGSQ